MRIQIVEIADKEVIVKSSSGLFIGTWQSEMNMPPIGDDLDVEIDVNIAWDDINKIHLQNERVYRIEAKDNTVIFRGKIDDYEDDMVYFRISADCLIMLDAKYPSCVKDEWYELSVIRSFIAITPFGN